MINVTKMWLYKYDYPFYMQSSVQAMDARLLSFFDIIFCVLQNYKFPEYPLSHYITTPPLTTQFHTTPHYTTFTTHYTHN
jgi:hypothetical protein